MIMMYKYISEQFKYLRLFLRYFTTEKLNRKFVYIPIIPNCTLVIVTWKALRKSKSDLSNERNWTKLASRNHPRNWWYERDSWSKSWWRTNDRNVINSNKRRKMKSLERCSISIPKFLYSLKMLSDFYNFWFSIVSYKHLLVFDTCIVAVLAQENKNKITLRDIRIVVYVGMF